MIIKAIRLVSKTKYSEIVQIIKLLLTLACTSINLFNTD